MEDLEILLHKDLPLMMEHLGSVGGYKKGADHICLVAAK